MSNEELDKTIPVRPPTVNKKIKPKTQRMGVSREQGVPCNEASQEKTLTPVGTAITIVADVK